MTWLQDKKNTARHNILITREKIAYYVTKDSSSLLNEIFVLLLIMSVCLSESKTLPCSANQKTVLLLENVFSQCNQSIDQYLQWFVYIVNCQQGNYLTVKKVTCFFHSMYRTGRRNSRFYSKKIENC